MLVRFNIRTKPDGRTVRTKGLVYTLEEHAIGRDKIDSDAVRLIQRLRQAGHQGYVVGGAVRDLLVGIKPKDFDIATDAHPNAVRKLFRNSRVIGRRFKIVHVYFSREKYLEVATFRSGEPSKTPEPPRRESRRGREPSGGDPAIYGGMAEDAVRRDFTLNALFYDPLKEQIVDYVGGVRDIRARRIRSIAPDALSFQEDPVRIIRAIKHAALVGFPLSLRMRRAIKQQRHGLATCSEQRLTEELYKILRCGVSRKVIADSYRLGVLDDILPVLHGHLSARRGALRLLEEKLDRIDQQAKRSGGKEIPTGKLLAALLGDCLEAGSSSSDAMEALRAAAAPLIPSNNDLRVAAAVVTGRGLSARP